MTEVPNRQPDIEFTNTSCGILEPTEIVRYWVDECVREIIHLQDPAKAREIESNIDAKEIYRFNKQFEKIGHMTDSGLLLFLEKYEHYLIEKELLS